MFILTTISDVIQIHPQDFDKPSAQALEDNINAKYSNKVIQKVGLCVCFYDLLHASEGLIGHGTGIVNVNVKFRLIVFRPFKGEILEGRISGVTKDGIQISLDFFEDIFVPGASNLFENTRFDGAEQVWVWVSENGSELFFDMHENVRFRVEAELWHDQSPVAPVLPGQSESRISVPYSIVGSMQQAGLGLTAWWE